MYTSEFNLCDRIFNITPIEIFSLIVQKYRILYFLFPFSQREPFAKSFSERKNAIVEGLCRNILL